MSPSLRACALQTDRLYEAISAILGSATIIVTSRSRLAASLCSITLEHGYSIRAVIEVDHVTSAIVLLRTQFEAVVRSMWIHYAAPDQWVTKVAMVVDSGTLKEPVAPRMDDMLSGIDHAGPESIGKMLRGLKEGAWKPLNSYVHAGIHPVTQQHSGYSAEYALQTLRNANGLATMAAMLMGVMSNNPKITSAIRQAQLDHLECLPPLAAG